MPLDESYAGDSGFYTDYVGTVKEAYFGPSEKGDPEALYLFLEMETEDPDHPEHTERFSLGKGWVTDDGGETVRHEEGKKKFNRRYSNYQSAWLDNAVKLLVESGAAEEFASRGPATSAAVWVGTKWQIEEHAESYQAWDKEAKKPAVDEQGRPVMRVARNNIPTALISLGGEGGAVAGQSNGASATTDLSWASDDLLAKLRPLAKAANSRDAFLDRVMLDVPELQEVEGALGRVASAGVYESLRG